MALAHAHRDPRAVPYAAAATALLTAALLFGKPSLAAAAAPFAMLLLIGLRARGAVECDASLRCDTTSPLEGDELQATFTIESPTELDTEAELHLAPGWEAADASDLRWAIPAGDTSRSHTVKVRPTSWGRLSLGDVTITMRPPLGLVEWQHAHAIADEFRVLPPPERVRQLLPPPASHALVGQHPSNIVGDGFDFAELRPFGMGDRMRDINWRATARSTEPQVNRRHPERNGEVVLLLDTATGPHGDNSITHQTALGRAARAAWSIGVLHVNSHDRVSLVAHGVVGRHVEFGGGDRARYALLETLLDVRGELVEGQPQRNGHSYLRLPRGALIIALTPLNSWPATSMIRSLHASGHSVVTVVVETSDLLPTPVDAAEAAAQRLYAIEMQTFRERLIGEGIPVAVWSSDRSLGHVVGALSHLRAARQVRR